MQSTVWQPKSGQQGLPLSHVHVARSHADEMNKSLWYYLVLQLGWQGTNTFGFDVLQVSDWSWNTIVELCVAQHVCIIVVTRQLQLSSKFILEC